MGKGSPFPIQLWNGSKLKSEYGIGAAEASLRIRQLLVNE